MVNGLKLKTKLLTGLLLVALIILIMGLAEAVKVAQIRETDAALSRQGFLLPGKIDHMAATLQSLHLTPIAQAGPVADAENTVPHAGVTRIREAIAGGLENFAQRQAYDDGHLFLEDMQGSGETYYTIVDHVLEQETVQKTPKAEGPLPGTDQTARARFTGIDAPEKALGARIRMSGDGDDAQAFSPTRFLYALVAFGIIASLGLGLALMTNVTTSMTSWVDGPGPLLDASGRITADVPFWPRRKQAASQASVQSVRGFTACADNAQALTSESHGAAPGASCAGGRNNTQDFSAGPNTEPGSGPCTEHGTAAGDFPLGPGAVIFSGPAAGYGRGAREIRPLC
jgi:hypothetical protein